MGIRPWSHDEDRKLRANYPKRGSSWDGWERLLPGRTESSIRNRAQRLDIRHDPYLSQTDAGVEGTVLRRVHTGMACSRIADARGIPDGKARKVVIASWADDKERRER